MNKIISTNNNCIYCGNGQLEIVYAKNIASVNQIVKCPKCQLMFVSPLVLDMEEDFWEGLSGDKSDNIIITNQNIKSEFNFHEVQRMIAEKEILQVKDFATSIKFVEGILKTKGKALEIGSSRGYFLDELQNRGWDVVGIEPSESRINSSELNKKYNILNSRLEEANLDKNSFDAIFCFHVIEHVVDPVNFVKMIYSILKPGGIAVIETPTYDSLSYKVLKHRERSIRCSGHLFFFTKKTLRNIVEKEQFKILKHSRVGRTLSFERLLWNISIIFESYKINVIIKKIYKITKINKIKLYLNIGDMQRIYCQKEIN